MSGYPHNPLLLSYCAPQPFAFQRAFAFIFPILSILISCQLHAQQIDKAQILERRPERILKRSSPPVAGNDMYEIFVEDVAGLGVGLYSVRTGPLHPVTLSASFNGQPQDLLVGASIGKTGTSYTTIRSFTSQTDYVQSEFARSELPFQTFFLDSALFNQTTIDTEYIKPQFTGSKKTGYRIRYALNELRPAPDTLEIVQIVKVHGRDFDDSFAEISTIVKNLGTVEVDIGIRYFWDLAIAGDDGPAIFQRQAESGFGETESQITGPDFDFFRAEANDSIAASPSAAYHVFGSVRTPDHIFSSLIQPATMIQASWLLSFFQAFSYNVHPGQDVTTPDDPNAGSVGGDSAILYYCFADTMGNPITIAPGDSVRVTQVLLASPPGEEPGLFIPPCDLDTLPPVCTHINTIAGPPKTLEFVFQDTESGLQDISVVSARNLRFDIPDFPAGTTEPVSVFATIIDSSRPTAFNVRMVDMCGNEALCDPIFLTLNPDQGIFTYHLEPLSIDRYFYLKNRGIKWIEVNLNGHEFLLATEHESHLQRTNTFAIPEYGEVMFDIAQYLKEGANAMAISYRGPASSQADIILSNLAMKESLDFDLELAPVPENFALHQNRPNPFSRSTTINIDLPEGGTEQFVELKIYNLLGQLVRTLASESLSSGTHLARWDRRDNAGRLVAAGLYLYSLDIGGTRITKKMALIKGVEK